MAHDSPDHDHEVALKQRALRNARSLVDNLEEDSRFTWAKEKKLLLLLGVVAIAVVGFVGISMMMGGSKEKDLALHRCEQEFVVKRVWEYTEELKGKNPTWSQKDMAGHVDKKRADFKQEAKASCSKGK